MMNPGVSVWFFAKWMNFGWQGRCTSECRCIVVDDQYFFDIRGIGRRSGGDGRIYEHLKYNRKWIVQNIEYYLWCRYKIKYYDTR